MRKEFDFTHNGYTGDYVIKKGYDIYEEWTLKKFDSRKIVGITAQAVSAINSKKTIAASAEALSYLFALDMRIGEKYNTFLKLLF